MKEIIEGAVLGYMLIMLVESIPIWYKAEKKYKIYTVAVIVLAILGIISQWQIITNR